jgi:hypothetical protein
MKIKCSNKVGALAYKMADCQSKTAAGTKLIEQYMNVKAIEMKAYRARFHFSPNTASWRDAQA